METAPATALVDRLLESMHQAAVDGARAASTRLEHMRWIAMAEMVDRLGEELASTDATA